MLASRGAPREVVTEPARGRHGSSGFRQLYLQSNQPGYHGNPNGTSYLEPRDVHGPMTRPYRHADGVATEATYFYLGLCRGRRRARRRARFGTSAQYPDLVIQGVLSNRHTETPDKRESLSWFVCINDRDAV